MNRYRIPGTLMAVHVLHMALFAAAVADVAWSGVSSAMDGGFSVGFLYTDPNPVTFCINICIYFAIVVVCGFVLLCLSAFWTWVYRSVRHVRPSVRMVDEDVKRLPVLGCVLTGYGMAFCALVLYRTYTVFDAFFSVVADDTGAGPLLGVLVGPMVVIMMGACMFATVVFAVSLPFGWFLGRRMFRYIRFHGCERGTLEM